MEHDIVFPEFESLDIHYVRFNFTSVSSQFHLDLNFLWPKFNLGATSNQTQSKPGFHLFLKRTSP